MYLEKLEIQGFKSFANKNQLEFSGLVNNGKRGITAIVGPNGSGKSNIADAVRWVLGEQSAKTLRGKKGEDIIFSGSDKKGRLGMAEVSLFLKNDNKKKAEQSKEASPFDYDELIITRRLNRNGDSDYLINNNRVRLSDIQMLLAKANIGPKTYSVIGQGIVENFLNTSATERKDFFDEATGVKSFQIKRDLSLNKLERSHENLNQVEMLLTEIKPRLKTLTRQVEKLKKKERLDKELKDNQLIYYNHLYQDIADNLDKNNLQIITLEKIKQEKLNKLSQRLSLNKKLNEISDDPKETQLNKQLLTFQAEKDELIKRSSRLQAEISLNLEAKGNFDLSWLNNKKEELKREKIKTQEAIEKEKPKQWQTKELELKEEWKKIQNKSIELEKNRNKREQTKEEINELNQQLIKIQIKLENSLSQKNNFNLNQTKEKLEELQQSLKIIETELNNFNLKDLISNIEKINIDLETINKNIKDKQTKLQTLNYEIKEKAQQGIGKQTISQEINAFLRKLEEIEIENNLEKLKKLVFQARQGFKEKIKNLIGFDEEKILEKIKTIQEEIIELGENRKNLHEKLNKLQLELSHKQEIKNNKINEQEKINNELTDIKKQIKLQENSEEIKNLEKEKESLEKEIEDKNKLLIDLNRNNYIEALNKEKEELLSNLNECRFKITSQEEKIKLLEQNYYNLNKEIADIEDKILNSQKKIEIPELKKEKENIDQKLSLIENQISAIKNDLKEIEEKKQTEKKEILINQNKSEEIRIEINELDKKLHELQLSVARLETRLEDLEKNIKNENLSLNEIKKTDKPEKEIDEDDLVRKINNSKKQLEQIGGLDLETEKEYEETKERYDFLNKQTIDLNQAINSLEKIITELDEQIKSRFEKEFKIITEKFNKYFNILFGGGQAKIIKLTEPEKEEDEEIKNIKKWKKKSALGLSGIDIQATPPGKKIQSITMLSGGERALTAIALICAIINANPSPFVVLDEVDAALDEANSEKLAQILDDLSNQTQFIIITHNRASMRKAEILYGITMQSDGVSKLLSVKMEEAIKIDS
jgi:chromosome segregation protein